MPFRGYSSSETTAAFSSQWTHPKDVFSVLLILGGDTVLRALGQLGGSHLTPVAFSFGWVACAISTLTTSFGENKLMPEPDCAAIVINGSSGYARPNTSWVIGRLVRDFEYWSRKHRAIRSKVDEIIEQRHQVLIQDAKLGVTPTRPQQAGLCISIFEAGNSAKAGIAGRDVAYYSGVIVILLQLSIAAIPYGLFDDWGILMITAVGNFLSLLTGTLSQWRKEKWACRRGTDKTVVLTRSNGAQHAVVVLGNGRGLDLEDLAAASANAHVVASNATRLWLLLLAVLWVLLLITAAGTQRNTWFLLAVGALGILQNTAAAGWRRRPEDFGVPLDFVEVIGHRSVMRALVEVERAYPRLGFSMRETFFPGALRPLEQREWEVLGLEAEAGDAEKAAARLEQKCAAAARGAADGESALRKAQEGRRRATAARADAVQARRNFEADT